MTGNSSDKQSFKSQVGIGSRSHDFDADERIIFDISSFVAGFSTHAQKEIFIVPDKTPRWHSFEDKCLNVMQPQNSTMSSDDVG